MTIETKYNIGDEVWVKKDYKKNVIRGDVIDLRATSVFLCRTPTIEYTIKYVDKNGKLQLFHRLEEELFTTKEELLKSL